MIPELEPLSTYALIPSTHAACERLPSNRRRAQDLCIRIRRHFRFQWGRSLTFNSGEEEILSGLSTTLRQETLEIVYKVCEPVRR
jgi:hypothetical protein